MCRNDGAVMDAARQAAIVCALVVAALVLLPGRKPGSPPLLVTALLARLR